MLPSHRDRGGDELGLHLSLVLKEAVAIPGSEHPGETGRIVGDDDHRIGPAPGAIDADVQRNERGLDRRSQPLVVLVNPADDPQTEGFAPSGNLAPVCTAPPRIGQATDEGLDRRLVGAGHDNVVQRNRRALLHRRRRRLIRLGDQKSGSDDGRYNHETRIVPDTPRRQASKEKGGPVAGTALSTLVVPGLTREATTRSRPVPVADRPAGARRRLPASRSAWRRVRWRPFAGSADRRRCLPGSAGRR